MEQKIDINRLVGSYKQTNALLNGSWSTVKYIYNK